MSLVTNIVGFSVFGLAVRFGQLAIQKRNLFDNMGAHLLSMGAFGFAGYWAYQWDERAAVLLAQRRAEIAAHRQRLAEPSDS